MKVHQKEEHLFAPVTLTLETRAELFHLLTFLNLSINDARELFNKQSRGLLFVSQMNDEMFGSIINTIDARDYKAWQKGEK